MSRQKEAYRTTRESTLGAYLRQLREQRGLLLREVAAAVPMDSTLLSKIERGSRFPTPETAELLAKFFGVPFGELERRRLASKFWHDNADNPLASEAALIIHETAPAYLVNKSVNKRRKPTG
jgi:HTH-type transcriptional regulator, competence development regulator